MTTIIETVKEFLNTPLGKGFFLTLMISGGAATINKIRNKYSWKQMVNHWFVAWVVGSLLFFILTEGFNVNQYVALGIMQFVSIYIFRILDEIDETLVDLNIILKTGLQTLINTVSDILKSKFGKKDE